MSEVILLKTNDTNVIADWAFGWAKEFDRISDKDINDFIQALSNRRDIEWKQKN